VTVGIDDVAANAGARKHPETHERRARPNHRDSDFRRWTAISRPRPPRAGGRQLGFAHFGWANESIALLGGAAVSGNHDSHVRNRSTFIKSPNQRRQWFATCCVDKAHEHGMFEGMRDLALKVL
jgi:hypothetical protein